jgi:hypothetical protein
MIVPPNIVVGHAIWSVGASGPAMVLAGVRAGLLMGAFLLLVPYGALGLAWAFAASDCLLLLVQTFYLRRKLAAPRTSSGEVL